MKSSRFSEEQKIGILKEGEANGVKATCAKYNISEAHLVQLEEKIQGNERQRSAAATSLGAGERALKALGRRSGDTE
jgi:hypothetical protein